jgi:hypothetical protein
VLERDQHRRFWLVTTYVIVRSIVHLSVAVNPFVEVAALSISTANVVPFSRVDFVHDDEFRDASITIPTIEVRRKETSETTERTTLVGCTEILIGLLAVGIVSTSPLRWHNQDTGNHQLLIGIEQR